MSNASIRRLIGGIGTLLVFLICGIVIWLNFHFGWYRQEIDVSKYQVIRMGKDGYEADLDIERLLYEERLPNPPASELDQYPEIKALGNLKCKVEEEGGNYIVKTYFDSETLKRAGIVIKKDEITKDGAYLRNAVQPVDVSRYAKIERDGKGGYTAGMDAERMLHDWGLDGQPDTVPAVKVIKNLVFVVTEQGDGYDLEMRILPGVTDGDAMQILSDAGIKIANLSWHLTNAEIEALCVEPQTGEQQQPADSRILDIPAYVRIGRADGAYTAELDVYRMLIVAGIDPETDPETNIGAQVLRSLDIAMEKEENGYAFHVISNRETVMDDLKAADLQVTNTKWTWTEEEMEQHRGTATPLPEPAGKTKSIDFASYVRTYRMENGDFGGRLDLKSMMNDMGVSLTADPETNIAAKALRSLGVAATKEGNGYKFYATSTIATVMEDLRSAGLEITNISWTWTEAEASAHEGTVEPLPEPDHGAATTTPVNETPDPTPGQNGQADPDPTTPAAPAHDPNAIDTLYGFDQTEVRKAIRAAKEQKYGTSLESSEVRYNYFAVGSAKAAHANVFRLVYSITTSSGTEYLVADVYDLVSETGYQAKDVHLTVAKDRTAAKSTSDLSDYQVYTLNEGSMVFPENKDKSPFNGDGLVMPKSISESVSYDELWDIPATDDMTLLKLLGYARNEMFARGGHQFGDSSNYRKFYSQYSWYKPTGKVTADELAKMYPATKNNITTIKFLEKLIKEG